MYFMWGNNQVLIGLQNDCDLPHNDYNVDDGDYGDYGDGDDDDGDENCNNEGGA